MLGGVGGGVNVNLEKSRFDWVFLNVGLPKSDKLLIPCLTSCMGYSLNCDTCMNRGIIKFYDGETGHAARISRNETQQGL